MAFWHDSGTAADMLRHKPIRIASVLGLRATSGLPSASATPVRRNPVGISVYTFARISACDRIQDIQGIHARSRDS
ncbi:hypothetical protein SISSUDRAFT_1045226 [Sistotremastrum suecicum HHB10207 ss-3]|uniref:Uncharacterized protein n=1 Tax=Sistotremastrum suecicum HHB10207 ss-3 TaxID=1314776 RepID=A0A166ELF6_9AGAM|nr:hypothetical protein SISSUDRAFT_1045226 [Sistotremastrum suecicum HHB10207 ss-3]